MDFKIAKFVFLKTGWFKNKLYQAVTFPRNDYLNMLTQKYYFC